MIEHVRSLDSTRPVTFVCNQDYNTDVAVSIVITHVHGNLVINSYADTVCRDVEDPETDIISL